MQKYRFAPDNELSAGWLKCVVDQQCPTEVEAEVGKGKGKGVKSSFINRQEVIGKKGPAA
jgi:hypothetical protein